MPCVSIFALVYFPSSSYHSHLKSILLSHSYSLFALNIGVCLLLFSLRAGRASMLHPPPLEPFNNEIFCTTYHFAQWCNMKTVDW